MAITITRTPWIDDDGTGTTGTVMNNAVKTDLYNQIDGALAKAAQLAGGNTFTGNQTLNGTVLINIPSLPTTQLSVGRDATGGNVIGVQNTNPGVPGYLLVFFNSAGANAGYISQTGTTTVAYNTASDRRLKTDHGRAIDVSALRAVVVHDFTWKADAQPSRGVFAQEAYAVFPRAIGPGTDEITEDGYLARPWMTDYSKFVPDLIVGWQQHDAALAELRALLAAVKG